MVNEEGNEGLTRTISEGLVYPLNGVDESSPAHLKWSMRKEIQLTKEEERLGFLRGSQGWILFNNNT